MSETALDRAHAAMDAAPEVEAARLGFYRALADCELFLLLSTEAEGESISPEVFSFDAGSYVLVFDAEERLADFVGKAAPYAALSGRALAGMLAGQGIGLGVNVDVAPSSILLPAEAVDWLAETLAPAPEAAEGAVATGFAPPVLAEPVMIAVETRLAAMPGVAAGAAMVAARFADGREGHILGIFDAAPEAEAPLAKAMAEAQVFAGMGGEGFDIAFFSGGGAREAEMRAAGRWFDVPDPAPEPPEQVQIPGSAPGRGRRGLRSSNKS
ncbi:SseB family protein [Rhodobacteraceae bacterium D3-12]|nr:SseB family protein [Rhodobacteraceae bacterium D3-12]